MHFAQYCYFFLINVACPNQLDSPRQNKIWSKLLADNTIDQNAIIDFHPEIPNVLMACGFSGHGLQQAPAAGRAAAELLASRQFQTIDLEIFSFDRCYGKKPPVFELGIV